MSRDRLLARDLRRELEAALLGDFDHLKEGSPDAQHFAMAFSPQAGQAWWRESDPEGPLGVAAKAVSSERRGERDAALLLYGEVAGRVRDPWVRLLGLLLHGWSYLTSDTDSVLLAATEIRRLRRSPRKARLLAKLSGFAADKGDAELSRSLWLDAIMASESTTQLGRALRIEGMNVGVAPEDIEILSPPPNEIDDDLVWPSEVERLQSKSASNALIQSVEDRFGGVWRHTIRMGVTPLGEVDSAEEQARWIGAPWLRRPLRKQIGAQLLAGAADGPEQWAQGVLAWALGGGTNPHMALAYAEPNFDHASADHVVSAVADCDPTNNRNQRLADLGAESWDLLSHAGLQRLALEIKPRTGLGAPAQESRKIWAALAIRCTDTWYESYRQFDSGLQAALLDSLEPGALRHFSPDMKETMYRALGDDEEVLAEGGRLLPLAAALAPPDDDQRLRDLVESEQPILARVVSQLKQERPAVVSTAVESRLVSSLEHSLRKQSEDARKGTTALGGSGPRIELGRLLSLMDSPDRDAVNLLVGTATDPELPPKYLMEARQGLLLLRRNGKLRLADLKRLRSAPEPIERGALAEGVSRGVLRVLLLQILAERVTAAERLELVGAVRSQEVRVRDIAVNACAEALQSSEDESLAWAVVSGLFDPSDSVAGGALAGLRPLTKQFKAASEVAWQRLLPLFDSSSRRVRSEVIRSLEFAPPRTRRQKQIRTALLARARRDRSWLVRDAAADVAA